MKTTNINKKHILFVINFLTQKIRECEYRIRVCDIYVEKEKIKLNNTHRDPAHLWNFRYERHSQIASKRIYQTELKKYQKLLSNKI